MTQIRKDALKSSIFICLGILMMVLFPETKGLGFYLRILGLLITLYQVIRVLAMSQSLLDDFFPKSKGESNSDDFPNTTIYNMAMLAYIFGLFGIFTQISQLQNTIKGGRLFWLSALTGLFAGAGLIFILKGKFVTLLNESNRRFSIILGFPLGLFLLIPAIASLINTEFAGSKTDCIETPILQKHAVGTTNSSFHVKLNILGEVENFEITSETYNTVSAGDTLQLCIKHGFLGYNFIDGFPSIPRR